MISKKKNMFVKKWKPKVASVVKINYNKSDVLLTDTVKILLELHIIIDIVIFKNLLNHWNS